MYETSANKTIQNIQYDEVQLSSDGSSWVIEKFWMPQVDAWSPIYRDIKEPFNNAKYTAPRLPVDLGPVEMKLIKECPRVLRTTIKPAGTLEVRLPQELAAVEAIVKRLLYYEYMINPDLKDFHAHLTLDHGLVEAGKTQRFPGWHGDGLQGGKFKEKLVCEHSYIGASSCPTELCLQPFFVEHLNEDLYNFFKAFDQQALESNVYRVLPNHVYLFDPYIVHRTPTITEDTERAFIRLTIANQELAIEYNTLNPMWDEVRPETKLDIRDFVLPPDVPIIYEAYGLKGEGSSKASLEENQAPPQSQAPFNEVKLSGQGETLIIPDKLFPRVQAWSPLYHDIREPFNLSKCTNPRLPIDLGAVDMEAIKACPSVLRMPLKYPDELEVRLPEEFISLKPLIERLFAYEKTLDCFYQEFAAHITIDHRIVEPGSTQRFPGFHADDLQDAMFQPKITTAHSYIVTSSPSTEICLQPFFVSHLHDTFEKVFNEFDKQARPENIRSVIGGHVYLVDPYNVHRSPVITETTERIFLRITFSPKEMLLPHNTINHMFDDKPYPGENAIHIDSSWWTVTPDRSVPWTYYSLLDRKEP